MNKADDFTPKEEKLFEDFQCQFRGMKHDLINMLKDYYLTYEDVRQRLAKMEKEAIWSGDEALIKVIKDVEEFFDKEKNGLLIK
ncbi:hypothetical protein ACFFGV_19710 [Pontibacillus salicampi]|uniref:DUF2089 family protein n=1 Tax=Pontibacillus salicampi TaxID=1449801 RepID=A0ABV6LU70_9BACI